MGGGGVVWLSVDLFFSFFFLLLVICVGCCCFLWGFLLLLNECLTTPELFCVFGCFCFFFVVFFVCVRVY